LATKILVVDDSGTTRLIVRQALRFYDCEVREAVDGETGLAAAVQELPDLIILDLSMPGMDGFGLLAALRQNELLKAIPVIVLTAASSPSDIMQVAKLRVSDYLVKPFTRPELAEKIGRIVKLTKLATQ